MDRKRAALIGVIILSVLVTACHFPLDLLHNRPGTSQKTGTTPSNRKKSCELKIVISSSESSEVLKTIVPGVDMLPAAYVLSGTGPNGKSFNVTTEEMSVTVSKLAFGDWTVMADAQNSGGLVVARGSTTTTLQTGETKTLDMVVTPLDGFGSLDLTVMWNADDVENPSVDADLVLHSGTTIDLPFSVTEPGNAVYFSNTIPTGYHSLVVKLLDTGQVVMGAIEVVRIVKDQTTTGTLEFPDINAPGGIITVNITPNLQEPIPVTMSGQAASIIVGEQMTVTASVPVDVGSVVYAWYVNGDSVATGPSYPLGAGLEAGFYRLDVTAFTVDGKRAGSASHNFTVDEGAQVSLFWDPNPEPDLAGYRLHYGFSAGNYTSSIDVGNRTAYIIEHLKPDVAYYITATAYNTADMESDYSNEVTFIG